MSGPTLKVLLCNSNLGWMHSPIGLACAAPRSRNEEQPARGAGPLASAAQDKLRLPEAWANERAKTAIFACKFRGMLLNWHKTPRKPAKTCGNPRKLVDKALQRAEGKLRNDS
jgi:hypothetical protein